MIPACFGLGQWVLGRLRIWRETQRDRRILERLGGSFPLQLAVTVATVVAMLERQTRAHELRGRGHREPAKEFLLPMVVELFHHPVAQGSPGGMNQTSTPYSKQRRMRIPIPRGCVGLP